MIVFLCLTISAIGYFLVIFLPDFWCCEAGVGIYVFCDVENGAKILMLFFKLAVDSISKRTHKSNEFAHLIIFERKLSSQLMRISR